MIDWLIDWKIISFERDNHRIIDGGQNNFLVNQVRIAPHYDVHMF